MLAPYPGKIWNLRATALVLVAVTTPAMVYVAVSEPTTWGHRAAVSQVVAAFACSVAAVVLYFSSRISELPALSWMVLCMAVYGIESGTVALLRAVGGGEIHRPGWLLLVDLAVALAVAGLALAAPHRALGPDPLATGIVGGTAVSLVHLELQAAGPAVAQGLSFPVIGLLVVALWLYAAFRLIRGGCLLPRWLTQRVALAFVLLNAGRVGMLQDVSGVVGYLVVIVALTAGSVLLLGAAFASLRFEIQRHESRLAELDAQVSLLQTRDEEHRSRMHEITNSMAGIAGASKIIHDGGALPSGTRARFEEMLDLESARLARLLRHGAAPEPQAADNGRRTLALDDLIRPLVAAQEAVGRRIEWTPTGDTALGVADDVSEALNVLVDNARKHAPDGTTSITVRRAGAFVEIAVADDGPGIPPGERERSFARGHRGARSHGQGLGLHLARTRLQHCQGSLELAPSPRGSTFVVRLAADIGDGCHDLDVREAM